MRRTPRSRPPIRPAPAPPPDTVPGFILAGVGHRTVEGSNFLVVKPGAFRRKEPLLTVPVMCQPNAAHPHPPLTYHPTPPHPHPHPIHIRHPRSADTDARVIEQAFADLTQRKDVGIILINQHVANEIRSTLRDYDKLIPTVLEIPSKDIPYDPEKDYIMQRVSLVLGGSVEAGEK